MRLEEQQSRSRAGVLEALYSFDTSRLQIEHCIDYPDAAGCCTSMKASVSLKSITSLCLTALLVTDCCSAPAQSAPTRKAMEDVNSPEVRERPGLHPNANLLFNGWGVTPAGQHIPISDMALKMVVAPDKRLWWR